MRNAAAQLEQAEARVEAERDASVNGVRLALARPGRTICIDCDTEIPPARLAVAPFACRCVRCQTAFERDSRGH